MIDATLSMMKSVFEKLDDTKLMNVYPQPTWHNREVSSYFLLLHILCHFQYHLGQINYHRRLLDTN